MITAGQFINWPLLHSLFGAAKVGHTGRRLRELKKFPSGKQELAPEHCAIFLYALFATKKVSEVSAAIESGVNSSGTPLYPQSIINFLTEALCDAKLRSRIEQIVVSQRSGNTTVYFSNSEPIKFINGFSEYKNYYGVAYDHDQVDEAAIIGRNLLIAVAEVLANPK